ncbi:hypothetical protein GJ496_002162 [Pomphorhynchus laevis]|nr:hypothetical protein GJ496_002162 [Pomphorhynchus laevis]
MWRNSLRTRTDNVTPSNVVYKYTCNEDCRNASVMYGSHVQSSKRITIIIEKVTSRNKRFKRNISEADINLNPNKHSKKRMDSSHPNSTIEEDWIMNEPVKEQNHQHLNDEVLRTMNEKTPNDNTQGVRKSQYLNLRTNGKNVFSTVFSLSGLGGALPSMCVCNIAKCAHCAGEHKSIECDNKFKRLCANCGQLHKAFDHKCTFFTNYVKVCNMSSTSTKRYSAAAQFNLNSPLSQTSYNNHNSPIKLYKYSGIPSNPLDHSEGKLVTYLQKIIHDQNEMIKNLNLTMKN